MKRLITFSALILISTLCFAKQIKIEKVEPAFWWTQMKNQDLQILVYGKNISQTKAEINYPGVRISKQTVLENPNYLFVDLIISEKAKAGKFQISFKKGRRIAAKYQYELLNRRENSAERVGFNNSDVMMLIMPDRFANGDESNDETKNTVEKLNRKDQYGRHGGDIKGVTDHLDYLQELGITSLWLNPVMENNQERATYHGYAISDYYNVDSRLGSNEDLKTLSEECNKRGMKLVKEAVTNHCGIAHWWMKDLPSKDWVHQYPEFTRSNFRISTIADPYAAKVDKELNTNGWFDTTMPDLNQKNPFLLKYLIQNTIWWIEYADLKGIRIDTYVYNDKKAMNTFCTTIMDEYPNFNIVGECWVHSVAEEAYWQKDAKNADGFNSGLPTVMDFPLQELIPNALEEETGWDNSAFRFYNHFAKDYLYANPLNNLVFLDNHDTSRFTTLLGGDFNKYKMAMTLLLTTRGIPQLYYGFELMTEGDKSTGDGNVRKEFMGGWKDHERSAFTKEGRTDKENKSFNFVSKLLNYRKNNPVLQNGKMMHYAPEENCYVFFRSNKEKTVMVILNCNKEKNVELKTAKYEESLKGFTKGYEVISGKDLKSLETISIPARSSMIIELK